MTQQKHLGVGKKFIGYTMYVFAFIMPLSNLPQIYQLFQTQVTTGLSLQTWVLYMVFGFIPLTYAITYKIKPLIITNILWTIVDLIMIIGIIRFGYVSNDNFEQLLMINNIGKTLAGLGFICLSSAAALFAHNIFKVSKK